VNYAKAWIFSFQCLPHTKGSRVTVKRY